MTPYLSINEVITCFRTPNTCTSRLLTDKKIWGSIPHLAVVATNTPNRITRTLLTTVVIVLSVDPLAAILQLVWGSTRSNAVAENQSG